MLYSNLLYTDFELFHLLKFHSIPSSHQDRWCVKNTKHAEVH